MTTDLVPAAEQAIALPQDPRSPKEIIAEATEKAAAVADVIEKQHLFAQIQGKKYVQVEGWVTLAAMYGLVPSIESTTQISTEPGGWEAKAELRRIDSGLVVATAEAECGTEGDGDWLTRPSYAQRSMAETRAVSKVCRIALSWVIVLAGYSVTPAEEVPRDGFQDKRPTRAPQTRREPPHINDLRRALKAAFGNDLSKDALEYVRGYSDAVTETVVLWEALTDEVCQEMVMELERDKLSDTTDGEPEREFTG